MKRLSRFLICIVVIIFCLVNIFSPIKALASYRQIDAFGTPGSGNGQFSQVFEITSSAGGNIYVADYANNRIQVFNSSGVYQSQFGTAGSGNGQFNGVYGVAISSSTGDIFVGDGGNKRVQRFNSSGVYQSQFGSSGSNNGQFMSIRSMATDASGNVYVVDESLHRVQKFNSSGVYQFQIGSQGSGDGQFSFPSGAAVDSSGNIFVSDAGNNRVQKFNSSGVYQSQFGTAGSGNGQLSSPGGIKIDSVGNIYVADTGNNRIQKFNSSGVFITKSSPSNNAQYISVAISSSTNIIYGATYFTGSIKILQNNTVPVLSNPVASNISSTSATLMLSNIDESDGGAITQTGFAYGTSSSLTTGVSTTTLGGSTVGSSFQSNIAGLLPATTYYYRAYATNASGTGYAPIQSFETKGIPELSIGSITSITDVSGTLNGSITDAGAGNATQHGFIYSTQSDFSSGVSTTTLGAFVGTGSFNQTISGLTQDITYYVKAYAINSIGIGYSDTTSFTTNGRPRLTNAVIQSVRSTSATVGGVINDIGSGNATQHGFIYSTQSDFSSGVSTTTLGAFVGTGSFNQTISGLTQDVTYYVKPYAINSAGVGYGSDNNFTTNGRPGVSTNDPTNINAHSATLSADIDDAGESDATQHGFAYGTESNLSGGDTATTTLGAFSGTGEFTEEISGLSLGQTYYYRPYVINTAGISFGDINSFNALNYAVVTTNNINDSGVTQTEATLDGNVDLTDITEHGFVYGTTADLSGIVATTTLGAFASNDFSDTVSGLTPGAVYYFKAYATNAVGTSYGDIKTFITKGRPILTTGSASSITDSLATLAATIDDVGVDDATEHGFVYGTDPDLLTGNVTTTLGSFSGTGSFTDDIVGLIPAATYYYRAYAINTSGIGYGSIDSFTTRGGLTITNCAQLQAIRDDLTESYSLAGNIDCSGFDPDEDGKGFVPIGNTSDGAFTGSLNGNGYTISNLTINRPEETNVGLFGYADGAVFTNINISGSVNGGQNTGSLLGQGVNNSITVSNVRSTADVTGATYSGVGGIIGVANAGSTITNTRYVGHIKVNYNDVVNFVGGIIGYDNAGGAGISGSFTSGDIIINATTSISGIGGLVGSYGSANPVHINQSSSTMDIYAYAGDFVDKVGGLVGSTYDNTDFYIQDSFAAGNISLEGISAQNIGGLVGYSNANQLARNISMSEIRIKTLIDQNGGIRSVGGLLGGLGGHVTIVNSFWNGSIQATSTMDSVYNIGGLIGDSVSNNFDISKSYAVGTFVLSAGNTVDNVGGIAGDATNFTSINDTFAVPIIDVFSTNGTSNIGSFIGYGLGGTITNNYYNKTISGPSCAGAVFPDPANCTAIANNIGYFKNSRFNSPLNTWDFTNTWATLPDNYPKLRGVYSPYPEAAPVVIVQPSGPSVGGGGGGGGSPTIIYPTVGVASATTSATTSSSAGDSGCPKGFVCTPKSIGSNINGGSTILFPRDLKLSVKGNDVKELQKFLNRNGFIISKTGAGSKGKETTLFGPATKNALIKFQKYYKITPASGYFGPVTKEFIETKFGLK